MRISENETGLSTLGFRVRASVSTIGVQLLRPSRLCFTFICGCNSVTSAMS